MDKLNMVFHAVGYYSATKRNEVLTQCYNMDEPRKHAK